MGKSKLKLKGRELVSQLTEISTPVNDVSWNPPLDARDEAGCLLVCLADRRLLPAVARALDKFRWAARNRSRGMSDALS